MANAVVKKGKESTIVVTQMRSLEPIATYTHTAPPVNAQPSRERTGGGRTSRSHVGCTTWKIKTTAEPRARPTRVRLIDASKKQYGTGLVYGSILEPTGGSVVQNAEIVASNRLACK